MRMTTLDPSPNKGDRLIEGYGITLDDHLFHIFVMEELTKSRRGYILKLMYEWGNSTDINLDTQRADFPEATAIFNTFRPGEWINQGRKYHCYKYIVFGHGTADRDAALSQLHTIVDHIENTQHQTN